MICNKCFLYAVSHESCVERHKMPAKEAKCYYFTPQVEVPLSQEEIWAIIDMLLCVRERGSNVALSSFYNKIRMVIPPSKTNENDSVLSFGKN